MLEVFHDIVAKIILLNAEVCVCTVGIPQAFNMYIMNFQEADVLYIAIQTD